MCGDSVWVSKTSRVKQRFQQTSGLTAVRSSDTFSTLTDPGLSAFLLTDCKENSDCKMLQKKVSVKRETNGGFGVGDHLSFVLRFVEVRPAIHYRHFGLPPWHAQSVHLGLPWMSEHRSRHGKGKGLGFMIVK